MATRKKAGVSKLTPRGEVLRHLNKQTFSVDASDEMAENIPNPAYRESAKDEYLGMLVHDITVWPKFTAPFGNGTPVACVWTSQVQTGDQTGAPEIMDLDNEFLFAHGQFYSWAATSVGFQVGSIWPVECEIVKALPIIVTPTYSILHGAVNNAEYNNEEVHTIIRYQVVEVPDRLFTQMLMNQSRTS